MVIPAKRLSHRGLNVYQTGKNVFRHITSKPISQMKYYHREIDMTLRLCKAHADSKVTPLIENEVTLARYPFLPQATEWIQKLAVEHEIDLDESLDGEWMEKARSRARIRLIDSIESKDGVAVVGGDIFTEEGRIIEAFSFYYARLVVFASEDERLISRWAQAEATRAEQVLTRDSENLEIIAKTFISEIDKDVDLNQTKQSLNATNSRKLRQSQDGNLWKIGMADFIEIFQK